MNLPDAILRGIVGEAMRKHIGKGKPEAVLDRLLHFTSDLLPADSPFFPQLFTLGAVVQDDALAPRKLGELFWDNTARSRDEVRRMGSFYTPAPIIDHILDLVWKDIFPNQDSARSVCDPAVGCGFFPLRLAERRIAQAGTSAARHWAEQCLVGIDTDPLAVFMTRILLWLALSDKHGEFVPSLSNIRMGDSLLGPPFGKNGNGIQCEHAVNWDKDFPAVAARGGFDCIIGNPPYEVLTNFSRHPERAELAKQLRASGYYHDSMAGQINLYRCFIERSLDLLRDNGAFSFIVPLSLTRDSAARPLREHLVERCNARVWRLYGERDAVFRGVTQSVCIFRAAKNAGKAPRLTVRSEGDSFSIKTSTLRRAGSDFSLPSLNKRSAALWLSLRENATATLSDLCTMRVGEVDQTFFRNCMADENTGTLLARGTHVTPFMLNLDPAPGKERFLREDDFLRQKGAAATACKQRASEWRVVQLGIRNMQSTPRLVAALAPPNVYLGNSLNVYSPKENVSLEYLAGLLNSRLLDWLFCATSGNNNINLHEMRGLPVPPSPEPEHVDMVERAYADCAHAAETGIPLDAARIALDHAILLCYGLDANSASIIGVCAT